MVLYAISYELGHNFESVQEIARMRSTCRWGGGKIGRCLLLAPRIGRASGGVAGAATSMGEGYGTASRAVAEAL
jgi:hypothetical protein